MADFRRAVLMGDPSCFRIRGGANPHTRTPWGFRKRVDRGRALSQWRSLADRLAERGVKIFVLPAVPSSPGLVFPANAGFLTHALERMPLQDKTFFLSRLVHSRAAEGSVTGDFLKGLGFRVRSFPERFEGEADFFPAGDVHLFTSGPLERQRFLPRWGWPPIRRVYGFRSDAAALSGLHAVVRGPVLPLTLTRETHYHGDTCLCAFGGKREFLLAYLPALSQDSQSRLQERFREKLLPLSEDDGEAFSTNAFQVDEPAPALFLPHRATARLQAQIRERGVEPVPVDVSEFMDKGGGSVKCMVGDLGLMDFAASVPTEVEAFRESHSRPAAGG